MATRAKHAFHGTLLALAAAVAVPALVVAAGEPPRADFTFAPASPRTGDSVRFTSSSCDPDGKLTDQRWDLDHDGEFDDGQGRVATQTFTTSGAHEVALQVTAKDGVTATRTRTVMVDTVYALPRPDSARLMNPFPVVTLDGRLTKKGARIKLLSVRAPVCALVVAACHGHGCPVRRASAYVGKRGSVRLRKFQRSFRAGNRLTVAVSKGTLIGKLTTFKIRSGKPPRRTDQCLRPGASTGSRCPHD